MEQIDLKQLIEQYPEVLTDGTKLKAYILDLYPQCKRGMVNILVAIQQCGIVEEVKKTKDISVFQTERWIAILEEQFGYSEKLAKEAINLWCSAINATFPEQKPTNLKPTPESWFEYADSEHHQIQCLKEQFQRNVKNIVIPTGTISINKGAFKNCFELEEVLISDSVNLISNGAFANCINLCNVDMPDSLAIIRFAAFSECKKLKSIMIPKGVVRIEGWAFAGCDSLTKIEVSKENSYYRSYRNCIIDIMHREVIVGCRSSMLPPDGSIEGIGDGAFYCCRYLTSITIPFDVTYIGENAFAHCENLVTVSLPDSLANIENNAFFDCQMLSFIRFAGTKEQWKKVNKGEHWDMATNKYIIVCYDGTLSKGEDGD